MFRKRRDAFLKWRHSGRPRHRDDSTRDVAAIETAIEDSLRERAAGGDAGAARNLRAWIDNRDVRAARRAARREAVEQRPLAYDGFSGGPDYDLNIELGPRSNERLIAACEALWSHPSLDGPYVDATREPAEQAKVMPVLTPWFEDDPSAADEIGLSHLGSMFGVATLPDGNQVPCVSRDFRDTSLLRKAKDVRDELNFSIPIEALDAVYEVGSAHQTRNFETWRSWAAPLEEWFAEIAQAVFREVPFRLASIGEEAGSGMPTASEVAAAGGPEKFGLTSCLFPAEDASLKWYPDPTSALGRGGQTEQARQRDR